MKHLLPIAAAFLLIAASRPARPQAPESWVPSIESPQYFAVWVEDVDRSVAWYAEAFGLEEIGGSEAPDGAWRIENLRSERLFVEIVRDDRAQPVERARGFGKVGFFVADIDEAADRIESATGERPRVLDFERFGLRLLQLHDPEGNIIQLHAELNDAAK